jgi:RND family efflux transporter MFP subunit
MQPHENSSAEAATNGTDRPVTALDPVLHRADVSAQAGHTPVHPRPGTGAWLALCVLVLAVVLACGFFAVNHRRSAADSTLRNEAAEAADAPMAVDVVEARYGSATRLIPLPGECRAWNQTTIYARVNGYVKKWFVDIGDHVKQGDVLATIETPELDQQLASEQAKVETCKAQIALAQANVDFSKATFARFKGAPAGIVSDLERDERAADEQTSQAKLTAAQSDLNSAQAEVDRLKATIAFQKVVAPFDGVITQRHVDIGDLVTSGSTANTTSLFTLADSSQIRVFVNVPESVAPDIHDGASAVATADEYPGREFSGRVARTSRAINDSSKTLRVEADIPNKDAALLPGMFVQVNFEVKGHEPFLVIPASAINFRSGGPQVATVGGDGHVTFHAVTIARDLGDAIEIKTGLKAGDRVILNVSYQIAGGDVVNPTEVELPGMPKPPVRAAEPAENSTSLSLKAN